MPGPLTYASIALMARDRLAQIRDALDARLRLSATNNEMEKQILYLVRRAHAFMTGTQPSFPPPIRLYGPPLGGDQVSKFLMLGAVGPEIPAYAALFAPGQRWLRDTIHKGTPDENKEQALSRCTDFVLEFWRRVQPLVQSNAPHLAAMRAYVLGHCCHIAADVVSAPFLDEVTSHRDAPAEPRLTRQQAISAIEVELSQSIFHRGPATRRTDWGDWWPTLGDVPAAFFRAYRESLEAVLGPGALRQGFGEYEEQRSKDSPPPLNEDLIHDGYATFRTVVQTELAWGFWDWMAATWWMFLPPFLAYPFAAVLLPNGKDYFRDRKPAGFNEKAGLFEVVNFPFAAVSLTPVIAAIVVVQSYLGASGTVIFGLVSGGLQVLAAIIFFASVGAPNDARWFYLFALPLIVEAIFLGVASAGVSRDRRRAQLAVSPILHMGISLIFLLCYWGFLHIGIEKVLDGGGENVLEFLGLWLLWGAILFGLMAATSGILYAAIPHRVTYNDAASAFVTGRPHLLRMFDDTTFFTTERPPSSTLDKLFYPSGRRKLLKMWWEGGGNPTVLSKRESLEFDFGGNHKIEIRGPLAPTSLFDFAKYLERNVKDAGNNKKLRTKIVFAGDPDYALPPGPMFSDHGDDKNTQAAHDAEALRPRPLGNNEETAYVLFHSPKTLHSVAFDVAGPTIDEEERATEFACIGFLNAPAASLQVNVTVNPANTNSTPLTKFFRPGDLVVNKATGDQRVVVSVEDDTHMTVSTPFPVAFGPVVFARAAQNRRQDLAAPGGQTVMPTNPTALPNEITGIGGVDFGKMFMPGDRIRMRGPNVEVRMVIAISSAIRMTLSGPIDRTIVAPGVPFDRIGEPAANLAKFVTDGDDSLLSPDSAMSHAADLAALLCLGATSHLLSATERDHINIRRDFGLNVSSDVTAVQQVFRNWNLDRRRVNEWRMLVLGGAVSEKQGDITLRDPALAPPPDSYSVLSSKGEPVSNQLGWLPLLRTWVEMASRREMDTKRTAAFKPGDPSNLDLSRGLAFLLDMPDPNPTAP